MFIRIILITMAFITISATVVSAKSTVPELFETSFEAETNGDYAKALNSVLEIIRSDTKNYTAILRSGWLFYNNKKYSTSIKCYQKAHKLNPKAIEPLLGLSLPLMSSKAWGKAEGVVKEIIKTDPNNYLANSRLAYILFSQGKYGEAKAVYFRVLQLYPGDIDMKLGLAWTYVRMGYKKKASAWFNGVLKVRRTNVSALAGMDAVRKM
jgi:tetratricopeptide (TPR) repeat protein